MPHPMRMAQKALVLLQEALPVAAVCMLHLRDITCMPLCCAHLGAGLLPCLAFETVLCMCCRED